MSPIRKLNNDIVIHFFSYFFFIFVTSRSCLKMRTIKNDQNLNLFFRCAYASL